MDKVSSLLEQIKPLLERKGVASISSITMAEIWGKTKTLSLAFWSRTTRRLRTLGAITLFL